MCGEGEMMVPGEVDANGCMADADYCVSDDFTGPGTGPGRKLIIFPFFPSFFLV